MVLHWVWVLVLHGGFILPFSKAEKKKCIMDQNKAIEEIGFVLIDGRLVYLKER